MATSFSDLQKQTLNVDGGSVSGDSSGSSTTSYNDPENPTITTNKAHTSQAYVGSSLSEVQAPKTTENMNALMKKLNSLKGPELRQLQERLFAGGFYGQAKRSQIGWGQQADESTNTAYKNAVLRTANINNSGDTETTLDDVIDGSSQTDAQRSASGSGTQALVTNPDQVKAMIQSVAPSVLGKRAPDDVVNKLLATFQSLESQENAARTSGDGTITAAPSGNAWFQEQLRQMMPETTKANQTFNNIGAVQKMFGGKTSPLGDLT